jgi:serine/threonine protein kinase
MSSQSAVIKPFAPGETVGPYTIVRLLPSGDGGQARVYEALQAGTQRRVALKVALSGKASFLRDEASFMRAFKLHHANIIQLVLTPIGGGMEEHVLRDPRTNAWYFAMEYLPGGSLADWLERRKKLPADMAVEIARQVALALDFAHAAGLVHLDVKPNNVLFRQPPEDTDQIEVVLTDFGISRPQVHITNGVEELTSLTVEYASPEQARLAQEPTTADETAPQEPTTADETAPSEPVANITVGPRSDLYSLATILYESITGHLPFPLQPDDDQAYLHKVIHDPPKLPIPDVPPDLNTILARALHKDAEARYPSARAFAEDLSRLPIKPASRPRRGQSSRSWIVGLVGLMAGLVIGFALGQAFVTSNPLTPTGSSLPPSLMPRVADTPVPDTPTPEATLAEPTNTPIPPTSTLRPTGTATTAPRITPSVAATAAQ